MPGKKRKYEETHPWINFQLNILRAGSKFWMLLGQVVARCEEVAAAILPPADAENMYALYLIRDAQATTAIKGNTLSEEQVRAQYEKRGKLPSSREYQGREVDNVLIAYDSLKSVAMQSRPFGPSPELICAYNRTVLMGLEEHLEEGVVPGEIPSFSVGAGRYRAAPRQDCDYLLKRLCDWLEQDLELSASLEERAQKMSQSILKGIIAHLYIAWIHPFGDGNGRTARLVEQTLLVSGGVPLSSAHLLSNHYNLTRDEYYRQLDRSSKVNEGRGDVFGFLTYALQGFSDGLLEQCNEIREIQLEISWEAYVYGIFRMEKRSEMANRRREVLFYLGKIRRYASKQEILNIKFETPEGYARKTPKTLTRDLNWLIEKGLIEKTKGGYRAKLEIMHGFRSPRVDVDQA